MVQEVVDGPRECGQLGPDAGAGWPAGDRSLVVAPSGHSMKAPAPPSRTTPSTDSSVGLQGASLLLRCPVVAL